MTIAPIVHTVEVKASPARAFDLFTRRIGDWWPSTKTPAKNPFVLLAIEPRVGGRWYERDAEGNELQWGEVAAYEPPGRLLLIWQLSTKWAHDPNMTSEVELTFAPLPGGGTKVTLEHRRLEQLGADAAEHAERLNSGWPTRIADYAAYADAHAEADA